MGHNVTLLATPSARLADMLRAAKLKVTDQIATPGDTLLSVGKVGPQAVLWRDNTRSPAVKSVDFPKLSETAPCLTLDVIDAAGAQSVSYYDKGQERWSVSFSADDAEYLAVMGDVPVDMERLTQEAREEAAETPDGEVYADRTPSLIFREITGFAYDESDRSKFRVIEGDLVTAKPWWKFW